VKNQQVTKAYKVTDKNMQCRGLQYELGKTYKMEGNPIICERGYHACLTPADCFSYYSLDSSNRVFEVELYGVIVAHPEDSKVAGCQIKFIRELTWQEVLVLVNTGKANTGLKNSGNYNSGYCNSGDRNSGNCNSGNCNSGNYNSGYCNSGNHNSGNHNSGNRNSGNYNSGYCNSGNCNSGDYNSGFFNSVTPPVLAFNQECKSKTHERYRDLIPYFYLPTTEWINFSDMTDKEKKEHPKAETCEGYLKTYEYKEAWQKAWDGFSTNTKNAFKKLSNFDPDVFFEITGINLKVK
jgi:hypothetical protein